MLAIGKTECQLPTPITDLRPYPWSHQPRTGSYTGSWFKNGRAANDPIADITCIVRIGRVKDRKLRVFGLWAASLAGSLALAGFAVQQVQPLIIPSTLFVSGLAALLFLRMLLSRFYRRGVDLANLAMQGDDAWPGKPKKFSDPDWGLFGKRTGTLPLLWIRAFLVLGILPAYLFQSWTGIQAGWLWFSAAFVVMELSIMHAAIDAHRLSD